MSVAVNLPLARSPNMMVLLVPSVMLDIGCARLNVNIPTSAVARAVIAGSLGVATLQ
jgi:hypothetical protein